MSAINDGGPAFPALEVEGGTDGIGKKDGVWHYPGMSLRDYFAAKAMQGILAGFLPRGNVITPEIQDQIAAGVYAMADAMLAARNQEAA